MQRKEKIKQMGVSYIIAVLLVVSLVSAAIVVSISKVDLITNYKDLQGEVWSIYYSGSSQGTDKLLLDVPSGASTTDGKAKTTSRLKIDLTSQDNYCNSRFGTVDTSYNLKEANSQYYFFDIIHPISLAPNAAERTRLLNEWAQQNGCDTYYANSKDVWGWTAYCVRLPNKARMGTISTPDKTFNTEISLISDKSGSTSPAKLSNRDTLGGVSAKLGNVAWIEWLGNLESGIACQNPTNEFSAYATEDNKWRVTDQTSYNNWWAEAGKYMQCLNNAYYGIWLSGVTNEKEAIKKCDDRVNVFMNLALSPKTTGFFITQGVSSILGDINSGQITFKVRDDLLYPQFRILAKADWVGIEKPVGSPEIVSTSSQKFKEGSDGWIDVSVKNKGSAEGSFSLKVAGCDDNSFSFAENIHSFRLNAGETRQERLKISQSSDKLETVVSSYCTVEFKETFTQEDVTSRVSVSAEQIQTCGEPNKKFCSRSNIYKCDATGQIEQLVEDCASKGASCVFENNDYVCKMPDIPDEICGNKIDDDKDGQIDEGCTTPPPPIGLTEIIAILIGALFAVSGYMKTGDKAGLIKGAIIGTIAAIIFYVVVTWIFKNIWLIIIGSILSFGALAYLGVLGTFGAFIVAMLLRR